MIQATIVALYGTKPEPLRGLLVALQAEVGAALGRRFKPYRLDQIHATIVGLERDDRQAGRLVNRNLTMLRKTEGGTAAAMDFAGLLGFLRSGDFIPFTVQIGGFAERDYPFTSRGARPFDRGFSLHGASAVMMGWPAVAVPGGGTPQAQAVGGMTGSCCYPPTLAQLRRGAERFGIVHAYHPTAAENDNDFYFRLGMIDAPQAVERDLARSIVQRLRLRLAAQPPVRATIGLPQLSVAFYAAPELPSATTQAFALDNPAVTGAFIADRLRRG